MTDSHSPVGIKPGTQGIKHDSGMSSPNSMVAVMVLQAASQA